MERAALSEGVRGGLFRYKNDNGWVIVVNQSAAPGEAEFTIAHELGHYLLHQKGVPKRGLKESGKQTSSP